MLQFLLLLLLGLALFALLLRWREPSLIYYPLREIEATPALVRLQFEDVWLTTADGTKIHGWYLPAPPSASSTQCAVLFLHGNAGNISHRLEKLSILHNLGVATLIIDYRGYGRSDPRQPDEKGTYLDAWAAHNWITKRHPKTILYGESLGTAIAAELATKTDVAGVILEEPFTSIPEVGQKLFPFLPVRLLAKNKYDTLSKMPNLRAPLLIFHSRDDEFFPFSYAERLLAAAGSTHKKLVELRGSHNDAFLVSADTYRTALTEFLFAHR